jgi:hypothetical protein
MHRNNLLSSVVHLYSCSENSAQSVGLFPRSFYRDPATPLHLPQLAIHQSDAHGYVKLARKPVSDLFQIRL